MNDLIVLLVVVAFFGLCVAYVAWCDRIIGDAPGVVQSVDTDPADLTSGAEANR